MVRVGLILALFLLYWSPQANAYCVGNLVYVNGFCIPPSTSLCPENSVYLYGVCHFNSNTLCTNGAVYDSGVCTKNYVGNICTQISQFCTPPQLCIQNCTYQYTCNQSYIMYNGNCVSNSIVQCPTGTVQHEGHCTKPTECPPNTYFKNGNCVQILQVVPVVCPSGSYKVNDTCVQNPDVVCPIESTFVNGQCVRTKPCGPQTFERQGVCVQCPTTQTFTGNICEPKKTYDDNTKTILSYVPPAAQPSEIKNLINLTNVVNSTNINNVVTNINSSNLNDLNLGSNAKSDVKSNNSAPYIQQPNKSKNIERCCVISEPRTCKWINGKYRCHDRRRHVCGEQCDQEVDQDEYDITIPPVNPVSVRKYYYNNPPQSPVIIQPPSPINQQSYQLCVYQRRWPYMDCSKSTNIDCSSCNSANMLCYYVCYQQNQNLDYNFY